MSDNTDVTLLVDDEVELETTNGDKVAFHWLDSVLKSLREGYFSNFFEKNEAWLVKVGLQGIYVLMAIGVLSSIVLPLRYDRLPWSWSLGLGLAWVVGCTLVQYMAMKMLPALNDLIRSTPTQVSSYALFDIGALLSGLAGVGALFGGIYMGIQAKSLDIFMGGFFSFALMAYLVSLQLKPALVNVQCDASTSAGQELLGLISFCIKGFAKMVPIFFGSAVLFGVLNLLALMVGDYEYISDVIAQITEVAILLSATLLPVIAYVLFLVYYFFVDLASAVLAIPQERKR